MEIDTSRGCAQAPANDNAPWHKTFGKLRDANVARAAEWGGRMSLLWRSNELAGEIGEVIEVIDALPNYRGRPPAKDCARIAEELADGVICIDLLGMQVGLPQIRQGILADDGEHCAMLGKRVGAICNIVKKIERERQGLPGSRASVADLQVAMNSLQAAIEHVALHYGINLEKAVAAKFNATSEKVGLVTRLVA